MSSGPFSRSNRNTPSKNFNKSQQSAESNLTPTQVTKSTTNQPNQGGYVYRPPTKITRTNANPAKQSLQQQVKILETDKQQPKRDIKIETPVKAVGFVRKTSLQTPKQTSTTKFSTPIELKQKKQQNNPAVIKPISRLNENKINDQLSSVEPNEFKKEQPGKSLQTQILKSPDVIPKKQSKSLINSNFSAQNNQAFDVTNSIPSLQIKKPAPYSYPKKITRRGAQNQTVNQQTSQNKQFLTSRPKLQGLQNKAISKEQKTERYTVTSLPYQRKNANLGSSNESKIIGTPSVSKQIKNPTKQQSSWKQQEAPKQQVIKAAPKRSPIISFCLHRLFIQKKFSYFNQLNQYSNYVKDLRPNEKSKQYFQKVIDNFSKNYQLNWLCRSAFSLIKVIYGKTVKAQMMKSIDPKMINILTMNRNQCFMKVLQNITSSQAILVRSSFVKLKQNLAEKRITQRKLQYATKIMANLETNKVKQHFRHLSQWANIKNQLKTWKIMRCSQINRNFKIFLLLNAFNLLSSFKLKQLAAEVNSSVSTENKEVKQSSSTVIETQPEQIETNKELKQIVRELEDKLNELKQQTSQASKQELQKSIQLLKQQIQQNKSEIQLKTQKSKQLKSILDTLIINKADGQNDQLQSLSDNKLENSEPSLSLIHEIYMKIYKQTGTEFAAEQNFNQLHSAHRVDENKQTRQIVAKSLALRENIALKNSIALYEGIYISEASPGVDSSAQIRKNLVEENEIIKKFIRSYIKERYMWEEVKEYVAAVINE